MSRSVVPDILEVLEPWLCDRIQEWKDQTPPESSPTLPYTSGGKVNVRALVAALGLGAHQAQHFFRHTILRTAVNSVAEEQGLLPIGSQADVEEEDTMAGKIVANRLRQVQARNSELSKVVAEQAAALERLRLENVSLREQLRLLSQTGQILRTEDLR